MIRKLTLLLVCMCLMGLSSARGQNSADCGAPLGDVVRQQREQRQHSKTAKRVVSDDDIPASHVHWMNAWVAEYKIIPAVKISALVPNSTSGAVAGTAKFGKIDAGFGPHLGERDWCEGSLDCAEESFLRTFQRPGWAGSRARILFDSDTSVGDYEARTAHFEVVNEVRGKLAGTVAVIQTPVATLKAYCIYNAKDRDEAEPECDAFISSLRVEVPQRYVYVHH
jgi:hypothetical protein